MRNPFTTAMALAGVLAFASLSIAQTPPPAGASNKPNASTGGPAPMRDLTGSWSGPVQIERLSTPPPLTPLGRINLSRSFTSREQTITLRAPAIPWAFHATSSSK